MIMFLTQALLHALLVTLMFSCCIYKVRRLTLFQYAWTQAKTSTCAFITFITTCALCRQTGAFSSKLGCCMPSTVSLVYINLVL